MKAKFKCIATALNVRDLPSGKVIGEVLLGDLIDLDEKQIAAVWAEIKVTTGLNAGMSGYVRRKWISQAIEPSDRIADIDRTKAAEIISTRTVEFDSVAYGLGSKAKNWEALQLSRKIDCSGWIYLLTTEILKVYGIGISPNALRSHSDDQITAIGQATKFIATGLDITPSMFQPGCLIGLDFAEYSWDRNRSLDIDHIVIVGSDQAGGYISQSSSTGGGINRVPLQKWLNSVSSLQSNCRMHLVDPLLATGDA